MSTLLHGQGQLYTFLQRWNAVSDGGVFELVDNSDIYSGELSEPHTRRLLSQSTSYPLVMKGGTHANYRQHPGARDLLIWQFLNFQNFFLP